MTVQEQYESLVETIRAYNPGADFDMIEKAYRYAVVHHGDTRLQLFAVDDNLFHFRSNIIFLNSAPALSSL